MKKIPAAREYAALSIPRAAFIVSFAKLTLTLSRYATMKRMSNSGSSRWRVRASTAAGSTGGGGTSSLMSPASSAAACG